VHCATVPRRELAEELQISGKISRLQKTGIPVDAALDYVQCVTGQYGSSASRHASENEAAVLPVDFQMRKMGSVPI
jgi:hypothetical protein